MTLRDLARSWLLPFVDPRHLLGLGRLPQFLFEWRRYRRAALSLGQRVAASDLHPCLTDRVARTPFDPHYLYQGAWLARRLADMPAATHVDVGSSVMMISVLCAHTPLVFVDYRPLAARLPNVLSIAGSATRLPFADASLSSVSCLHVVEHIGLGRYGDPLDPDGSRKAVAELGRVVAFGGRLYLSAPTGRERVCFNAHRVFAPQTLVGWLPAFSLERFCLVDDAGRFVENAPLSAAAGLDYGCGMFELRRHAG